MDEITATNLADLRTGDKERRYRAFLAGLEATDAPVDWAYDVWDAMVSDP